MKSFTRIVFVLVLLWSMPLYPSEIDGLQSKDPRTRWEALKNLTLTEHKDIVVSLLKDENVWVRGVAAETLARLFPDDKGVARELIISFKTEKHKWVRQKFAKAFVSLSPEIIGAEFDHLKLLMGDRDNWIRYLAGSVAPSIKIDDQKLEEMVRQLGSDNSALRKVNSDLIIKSDPEGKKSIPLVFAALKSKSYPDLITGEYLTLVKYGEHLPEKYRKATIRIILDRMKKAGKYELELWALRKLKARMVDLLEIEQVIVQAAYDYRMKSQIQEIAAPELKNLGIYEEFKRSIPREAVRGFVTYYKKYGTIDEKKIQDALTLKNPQVNSFVVWYIHYKKVQSEKLVPLIIEACLALDSDHHEIYYYIAFLRLHLPFGDNLLQIIERALQEPDEKRVYQALRLIEGLRLPPEKFDLDKVKENSGERIYFLKRKILSGKKVSRNSDPEVSTSEEKVKDAVMNGQLIYLLNDYHTDPDQLRQLKKLITQFTLYDIFKELSNDEGNYNTLFDNLAQVQLEWSIVEPVIGELLRQKKWQGALVVRQVHHEEKKIFLPQLVKLYGADCPGEQEAQKTFCDQLSLSILYLGTEKELITFIPVALRSSNRRVLHKVFWQYHEMVKNGGDDPAAYITDDLLVALANPILAAEKTHMAKVFIEKYGITFFKRNRERDDAVGIFSKWLLCDYESREAYKDGAHDQLFEVLLSVIKYREKYNDDVPGLFNPASLTNALLKKDRVEEIKNRAKNQPKWALETGHSLESACDIEAVCTLASVLLIAGGASDEGYRINLLKGVASPDEGVRRESVLALMDGDPSVEYFDYLFRQRKYWSIDHQNFKYFLGPPSKDLVIAIATHLANGNSSTARNGSERSGIETAYPYYLAQYLIETGPDILPYIKDIKYGKYSQLRNVILQLEKVVAEREEQ